MSVRRQRRIVVTGGPGAGKTAALELARRVFARHVVVLHEAASIVFGGGFPREASDGARRAAQRAIFHVQVELERLMDDRPEIAVVLCDRGTVDGLAYWPGTPEEYWDDLKTTYAEQLAQYDAVIHLRTPPLDMYEPNALRVESAREAAVLDGRIAEAWSRHPRRYFVASTADFVEKMTRVVAIVAQELPPECREEPVRA